MTFVSELKPIKFVFCSRAESAGVERLKRINLHCEMHKSFTLKFTAAYNLACAFLHGNVAIKLKCFAGLQRHLKYFSFKIPADVRSGDKLETVEKYRINQAA